MLTLSILLGNLHCHRVPEAADTDEAFRDAVASRLKNIQANKKAIKTQQQQKRIKNKHTQKRK